MLTLRPRGAKAACISPRSPGASGHLHSEAPADEDQQGGALFAPHPLGPLIPLRVDTPFDLHVLAVPGIGGVLLLGYASVGVRAVTMSPGGGVMPPVR